METSNTFEKLYATSRMPLYILSIIPGVNFKLSFEILRQTVSVMFRYISFSLTNKSAL